MLCRYETAALKSLDIFSVHGFPVGLIQCESNLLGIMTRSGVGVGSGGWTNITAKYEKAKRFCHEPFEVDDRSGRKRIVRIPGEWTGERIAGKGHRRIEIHCGNSSALTFPPDSFDAVFTDPPYFSNVQYAELMDFCYVWLRRLVGPHADGFERASTRSSDELTGNATQVRDIQHYTDGISAAFCTAAQALKSGAPLAFTFHYNTIEAYHAIGVAVLDTGFTCSAAIPCPTEMRGSVHIHGTHSSVVDTVFVCRRHGEIRRDTLFEDLDGLAAIARADVAQLRSAGVKPTAGDIRCIVFGHITRMAIWRLRPEWDATRRTCERLDRFSAEISAFGDTASVIERLAVTPIAPAANVRNLPLFSDHHRNQTAPVDALSF